MGKKELQDFIKTKKESFEKKKVDWNEIKKRWLKKLDELYENIEIWFKDLKDSGDISINYSDINLNEENLGIYTAKKMIITIYNEQVLLEPIGTLLIGAKGRVDMIGKNGKVKIVLAPKLSKAPSIKISVPTDEKKKKAEREIPIETSWKLAKRLPDMTYEELTSDSFSDAVREVIGA